MRDIIGWVHMLDVISLRTTCRCTFSFSPLLKMKKTCFVSFRESLRYICGSDSSKRRSSSADDPADVRRRACRQRSTRLRELLRPSCIHAYGIGRTWHLQFVFSFCHVYKVFTIFGRFELKFEADLDSDLRRIRKIQCIIWKNLSL